MVPALSINNQKSTIKNLPPILAPGQGSRRLCLPPLLPEPSRRFHRRLARSKQPVQRRTGARQRRILRAGMLQHMLSFTQFGILRKDDFFEVVLDPGPDKLEKRVLGSAPSKRSTGVTLAQPCRIGTTKLNHSIGWLGERQFGVGKGGASVATYPLGRTRCGCSLAGK